MKVLICSIRFLCVRIDDLKGTRSMYRVGHGDNHFRMHNYLITNIFRVHVGKIDLCRKIKACILCRPFTKWMLLHKVVSIPCEAFHGNRLKRSVHTVHRSVQDSFRTVQVVQIQQYASESVTQFKSLFSQNFNGKNFNSELYSKFIFS